MAWYWWIFIFFMMGGFGGLANMGRQALATRHERQMERQKLLRKERQAIEAANKPPEPICGCTHHLAKHDKAGKCHESVEQPTAWDENKKPVRFEAGTCNCQQYVGPQPLSQVYADELTDLA
ncbi:hypothetical protein GCM10010329_06000 [Streptomyces spiroverticillatus]|uniref:Uncharacterized protein n=1 Tax=Streptomyces finlayi TaxID=67296 RepID=A0A918WSY8_9ACTN|nr:hypothetical protein [Streptomyces finlayi]GGZ88626.1 hypothetical protein GCM10010329_06000 [Streptomyces spiroverticillatus]GHC79603.1 hypothetical protein GCM10010334_05980 [Streptomyces finlayi]